MSGPSRILGTFSNMADLLGAGRAVREGGMEVVEAFSPYPSPEVDALLGSPKSPIRYFTLFGGLLGLLSGFALTIGVALRLGLVSGGKPVVSIPPYVIIAFELTILFGGLSTMLGFLLSAIMRRRLPKGSYHSDFTVGSFGLLVGCRAEDVDRLRKLLSDARAVEVKDAED
jgi:hypothetical protein